VETPWLGGGWWGRKHRNLKFAVSCFGLDLVLWQKELDQFWTCVMKFLVTQLRILEWIDYRDERTDRGLTICPCHMNNYLSILDIHWLHCTGLIFLNIHADYWKCPIFFMIYLYSWQQLTTGAFNPQPLETLWKLGAAGWCMQKEIHCFWNTCTLKISSISRPRFIPPASRHVVSLLPWRLMITTYTTTFRIENTVFSSLRTLLLIFLEIIGWPF
jgi:hypothetical protein